MSTPAFFAVDGSNYTSLALARSYWSPSVIGGPATCAALARQLEQDLKEPAFKPSRFAVDLFKPTPAGQPLNVDTRLIRRGRRIIIASASLSVRGETTAQARCTFLREGPDTAATIWTRDRTPPVPSDAAVESIAKRGVPLFGSDGHPQGWSMNLAEHQGSTRKRMWSKTISAVEGEEPSPFVVAAIVSEATSLVTNWGDTGLEFINADISLSLARTPATTEMGVEADCHISDAGVAAGSAILYDRDGPLGISSTVALVNSADRIDLSRTHAH